MYPSQTIAAIKNYLVEHHQTIAVAESVTSGHLQAALSQAENARAFYQGGITAYNLGQKSRHLSVEPIHALDCNCVSDIVSRQMALGVRELFSADFGIGITGYAAKVPEKHIFVPFAYFSIFYHNDEVHAERVDFSADDSLKVQLYFTAKVLEALLSTLSSQSSVAHLFE